MSRASFVWSLPSGLELDLAARKVSISSSISSHTSQRRPFAPIDIQASPPAVKGDPDTSLRLVDSGLYTVYAMESFTFGNSSSHTPSSSSPGAARELPRPLSSRSHASHYFPAHARPGARNSLSIIEGYSSTRSHSNRTSVTSPSSMMFNSTSTSNPTTPSLFTFESDPPTSEGSELGEEYAISIGSTRYEDDGSIASSRVRRASSAYVSDDGRYVPPNSEDAPSERRVSVSTFGSFSPPPRSNSLRPVLNIETSPVAPPFDADNLDEQSEEEPATARPHVIAVPVFHYPTRAVRQPPPPEAGPSSQELDTDWFKSLGGGIVTFDIDDDRREKTTRPPLPSPKSAPETDPPLSPTLLSPTRSRRSSFFSRFRKNSSSAVLTTGTSTTFSEYSTPPGPDDTFESHARQYQPARSNEVKWVFRRSLQEERKHAQRKERRAASNPKEMDKSIDSSRKGEIWSIPGIEGMYWLKRVYTDASSYQLAVQYIAPHSSSSKGDSKKLPVLLVHRHSRVLGFSLGWVRKESTSSSIRPPSSSDGRGSIDGEGKQSRKHHTMHLLATRDVQESYTSTVTVRRLEEWGLLASPSSSADKGKAREVPPGPTSEIRQSDAGPSTAPGSSRDTPRSTTSAPSVLFSPRQQTLLGHPSSPPLPPSPSASNQQTDEDDPDADSVLDVKPRKKATSHFEAFGTISASEMVRFRGSTEVIQTEQPRKEQPPPANEERIRKFLWSGTRTLDKKKKIKPSKSAPAYLDEPSHSLTTTHKKAQHAFSEPSVRVESSAANRFTSYRPPWLTFSESSLTHAPPLSKQEEEKRRVVENLNKNFNRVGLITSSSSDHQSSRKSLKNQKPKGEARTTVFDGIPRDALFMLLPLWVGSIQGKGQDDVRFLMIWYKVRDNPPSDGQQLNGASGSSLAKLKARVSLRNSRADEERERKQTVSTDTVRSAKSGVSSATSKAAATPRRRSVGDTNTPPEQQHKPFHVLARLVTYNELQGSGIRVPDSGLQGISSSSFPDVVPHTRVGGDHLLTDYILARCPASSQLTPADDETNDAVGGVEFDDECMVRLGLAVELPSSRRRSAETSSSSSSSPSIRLTHIGRSVIEMAWMGSLALIEFQAV